MQTPVGIPPPPATPGPGRQHVRVHGLLRGLDHLLDHRDPHQGGPRAQRHGVRDPRRHPILTGSLSRIFLGIWTDQYGGRVVFTVLMAVTAVAAWMLSTVSTYPMFLLAALGVGLAGGSFAVGIAFVSRWYERERQGTALGMFGIGNAGAAVTNFGAPFLLLAFGWERAAQIYAVVLLVTAVLFFVATKEDPVTAARKAAGEKPRSAFLQLEPLRHLQVWRFSLYYFFVFGAFVALALWLPRYYVGVYGLGRRDRGHAGRRLRAAREHLPGPRRIPLGSLRRAPRHVLDVHRERRRVLLPELSVDRLRRAGGRGAHRVQHHHLAPGLRLAHGRPRLRDVARKGGGLQAHPGLLPRARGLGRRARRDDRRARRVRPPDLLRGDERLYRGMDELLHAALRPGRGRARVDARRGPPDGAARGGRAARPASRASRAPLRARGGAPRGPRPARPVPPAAGAA